MYKIKDYRVVRYDRCSTVIDRVIDQGRIMCV